MFYFNYATDDLIHTKIEFTFRASHCHVGCSEIYPVKDNCFGSHNNILDFESLQAEIEAKISSAEQVAQQSSKKMDGLIQSDTVIIKNYNKYITDQIMQVV